MHRIRGTLQMWLFNLMQAADTPPLPAENMGKGKRFLFWSASFTSQPASHSLGSRILTWQECAPKRVPLHHASRKASKDWHHRSGLSTSSVPWERPWVSVGLILTDTKRSWKWVKILSWGWRTMSFSTSFAEAERNDSGYEAKPCFLGVVLLVLLRHSWEERSWSMTALDESSSKLQRKPFFPAYSPFCLVNPSQTLKCGQCISLLRQIAFLLILQ